MLLEESLQAWLGHAKHDLTEEQLDQFTTAAKHYYDLPFRRGLDKADFSNEDQEALNAILQTILNEDTLENVAQRAQHAEEALDAWIRAAAVLDIPEAEIARRTNLHRSTVRSRLGK